jgi:hypothetical protein
MNPKRPQHDSLDRLLHAAARAPAPATDDTAPTGFAARVWSRRNRSSVEPTNETLWALWRRWTTVAATLATGMAVVASVLPQSAIHAAPGSGSEEPNGWELQIAAWVFEP